VRFQMSVLIIRSHSVGADDLTAVQAGARQENRNYRHA
jgi:hypothetical protein